MKSFKAIFIIRFVGYLVFFTGLLGIIFMLGPIIGAQVGYNVDRIRGVKRTVPEIVKEVSAKADESAPVNFGSVKDSENSIIPVSTEFGIVIEKINANARIIPNVDPTNEKAYVAALKTGVAEALGSTPPGKAGNLYLFSHSTDAPWNIVRFNAIFFLLRELDAGDKVIIFYNNKRYDYIIFDKIIAAPTDVSYLTNRYNSPILTMQTCDPPGTLFNRLVVRARLVNS